MFVVRKLKTYRTASVAGLIAT